MVSVTAGAALAGFSLLETFDVMNSSIHVTGLRNALI